MSDRQRIRAAHRKAAKLFMAEHAPNMPRKERREMALMLAKRKVPSEAPLNAPH